MHIDDEISLEHPDQVFRWQQRLWGAPAVSLRLELESERVEWFLARLRHILNNIFSNAVKSRDSGGRTVTIESGEGQGTTVTFALPH